MGRVPRSHRNFEDAMGNVKKVKMRRNTHTHAHTQKKTTRNSEEPRKKQNKIWEVSGWSEKKKKKEK